MSLYLDESIEMELGIHFRRVDDKEIERMHADLDIAASHLGFDDEINIHIPEKGVLVEKLLPIQRNMIGLLLSDKYAEANKIQREELGIIPLKECNEKMLSVREALDKSKIMYECSKIPFHEACGPYAGQKRIWYLRAGVVDKIVHVFRAFNAIGYYPYLEDCYRPREVQRGLLMRRIADLAASRKEWSWETVSSVALSLTASVPGMAGHMAGAALDLRLKRQDGDAFLDLGNEYAESTPISSLECPYITAEQLYTRTIFSQMMNMAHIKLLSTEDWHCSHGDRGMGIDLKARVAPSRYAIYGPLSNFNRESGEVIPYHPENIDVPFFNDAQIEELVDIRRRRGIKSTMHALEIFQRRKD